MQRLTKDNWKGLWGVFWRVLILAPIFWVLGLVLLLLVMAAFIVPPVYAVCAFITGDWFFGLAALVAWVVVLRNGRSILRWVLEGIEYASI
jgi:hypothetical protein